MKFFLSFVLSVLCFALPAQDTNAPILPATQNDTTTNLTDSASVLNGYILDDKHKLAPGDKVSFQILEDKDPPKSLTVTDSGELDVPYIGRVIVANKTCKQVA